MSCSWKGHYIGRWILGKGIEFTSYEPSEGEAIWCGRIATNEESRATRSASLAFLQWSKLTVSERAGYLRAFVETLKTCKTHLADCISLEIGKPKWEAATEIGAMIGKCEPTEQAYRERSSDISRQLPNGTSHTRFRPHGVVAIIGPYNFPGHMPNGHIMPALLAGNTVVLKPSEYAPATSEQIIECWTKVGLPHGVLNMVQGDGSVGMDLCRD